MEEPPPILEITPADGESLDAFGQVRISFSEPMEQAGVEAALSIFPSLPWEIFWKDNTHYFQPNPAFSRGVVYQASLAGKIQAKSGKSWNVALVWDIPIREPDLVYWQPDEDGGEIWRMSLEGETPRQLTQTGNRVLDYAVDRIGKWIVFTLQNDKGGQDLWVVDRDGSTSRLLENCEQDRCSQPAWSMDNIWIAYARDPLIRMRIGLHPHRCEP